jgi:hypothetical protein
MTTTLHGNQDIELQRLRTTSYPTITPIDANRQATNNEMHSTAENRSKPTQSMVVVAPSDTLGEEGAPKMDGTVITASRARKDFAIGILLLLLVVVLWTASNFITQVYIIYFMEFLIAKPTVTQILFQEGFDEPFLLTYLNTSSFAIYLIPFLYRYFRTRSKGNGHAYEPLAHEPSVVRVQ